MVDVTLSLTYIPLARSSPPLKSTHIAMLAHIPLLATLLLGLVAHATPEILETNLAYRSPYLNEPGLSIDTRAVHARHVDSHVQIKREITLGKLKRDLSGIARRDAGEIVRPDGEPSGYTYKGYGLGVTDWGTAGYVYAGNLNFTHSVASGMSLLQQINQFCSESLWIGHNGEVPRLTSR